MNITFIVHLFYFMFASLFLPSPRNALFVSYHSNSPVTVISYAVDVAKADSSLTIADQPSMASLLAGFRGSPHTLCACVPLRSRIFSVVGPLNPDNMTQIEEAIRTAWKKENPSESFSSVRVKSSCNRFRQKKISCRNRS